MTGGAADSRKWMTRLTQEKSGVSSKEHRIFISSGEVSPDIKAPEGDMRRFGYEN